MKRVCRACLLAAVVSSCSQPAEEADRPEGEQFVKELIQARHDVADSVTSVTDEESARQSLDAFREAHERSRVAGVMVSRLPDRQRFALQKKYRDELNGALLRMDKEMRRVEDIPDLGEIFLDATMSDSVREAIPESYRRTFTD